MDNRILLAFLRSLPVSLDRDKLADELLVSTTTQEMRDALNQAKRRGAAGWWDPDQCSVETLKIVLAEHIAADRYIHAINIAAMLNFLKSDDQQDFQ